MIANILVATDFSAAGEMALVYGRALARAYGATLHVLHVVDHVFVGPFGADPSAIEEAALASLNSRVTDDDRTLSHARAVVELAHRPAKAIVAYSQQADIDLIVTGTHGRSGPTRLFLGSVADQVIRTALCPVLTVKPLQKPSLAEDPLEMSGLLVIGEGRLS